jgi:hypothetical protein
MIIFDVASLATTPRENATYFLNLTKYFKIYLKKKANQTKNQSPNVAKKDLVICTWQSVASHDIT